VASRSPRRAIADLDALADDFGLEVGETYPLDLFFAERHVVDSHFHIETTISTFVPPVK